MTASRPRRSIGVGVDGASWLGVDDDGAPVVWHRLRPEALAAPGRRRRLQRRLSFQQALTAPAVVERVVQVDLDGRSPVVVVQHPRRTLALAPTALSSESVVGLVETMAAAHARGIVHGALSPVTVVVDDAGRWITSWLGLETGAWPPPSSTWPLSPSARVKAADDVLALGLLLIGTGVGERGLEAWRAGEPVDALPWAPSVPPILIELAVSLCAAEPADRPAAVEIAQVLRAAARAPTAATVPTSQAPAEAATWRDRQPSPAAPARVGRFTLVEPLGAGAMGQVWRAVDDDSGEEVAVKLIGRELAPSPRARRRFRKEARLLSELQHPGVARAIESGELDDGTLFLATELARGRSLGSVLKERGPLPEAEAVALIVDLARALAEVHDAGIVHRDIKPENIIVVDDDPSTRVKLIDFGVARHLHEEGSLAMTREGAVLGSPLYMPPEQARGDAVDGRSDLYALGTTLYEMLIGRAPFAGHGIAQVLAMQIETPAPRVRGLRQELGEEIDDVVARLLEKDPAARFADARALLEALAPLRSRAAAVASPGDAQARRFEFAFVLRSSPAALWPFVANTDRLNKAIGLGAAIEQVIVDDDDIRRMGRGRQAGFALAWEEHPFEWVYQQRLGVLREYSEGPLRWLRSSVELQPTAAGTRLVQAIAYEPRGVVGRVGAEVEIGVRMRRGLERTYARIDALLQGRLGDPARVDAFEPPPRLAADVEARFALLERQVVAAGAAPLVVHALGDFLRTAPAADIARIRPVALARRLGVDDEALLAACIHAAAVGLLVPAWDILCPSCRVPSSIEASLRALREHGRCEVCNLAFAIDLASSIELVFQLHRSLREADAATYCISSPAHTPHVMVQVRLAPGERRTHRVQLPEGLYHLVTRPVPSTLALRVRPGAALSALDVVVGSGRDATVDVATGEQLLTLVNDTDRHQQVRIERAAPRDDVVTAARALSSSLFRRLLPDQIPGEGTLLRVSSLTMLAVVPASVQPPSIEQLYPFYRVVDDVVAAHAGCVVRLHGDGVLASFVDAVAAARAVRALAGRSDLPVAAAVHRAPAGAVTFNERVDYFGRCVQEVIDLVDRASAGELVLSRTVGGELREVMTLPAAVRLVSIADLDDDTVRLHLAAGEDDAQLGVGESESNRRASSMPAT